MEVTGGVVITSGRTFFGLVSVSVAAILLTTGLAFSEQAQAQTGNGSPPDPSVLVGAKAPPLAGPNIAGSGQVDLSRYLGKPVVVVFWLNTCPHCRRDLPKINAYQRKLGKQVQIIGVALNWTDGTRGPKGFETPAAAIKTLHLTMPTVLYDATAALNPAPGQWAVRETPTAYVISPGGAITAVLRADLNSSGEVTASDINRALAQTNCGCALKSGPGVA